MKVILTERVKTLGNVGEIVNVSEGYGRNYLIPKRLAVFADDSHKSELENHQKRLAKKVDEQKASAVSLKGKIDKTTLTLVKKVGGSGKLFGTVTNSELAKMLEEKGIEIERRLIVIKDPIKTLGSSEVAVKLFTGVEANLKIKVVIDPEQEKELKARQVAAEKRAKAKKKEKKIEEESGEESKATDASETLEASETTEA